MRNSFLLPAAVATVVLAAPAYAQNSVETAFGSVLTPSSPERIAALGWSDADVVLALGLKPVVVLDWLELGGKGVGPWAEALFGDDAPIVLPRADLNFEQVAAADPDIVLSVQSQQSEDEFQKLSALAPTIFGPAGHTPWTLKWNEQTTQIAAALGRVEQGEALIADLQAKFAAVRAEHPEFAHQTVVVASKFDAAYGISLEGDVRQDVITSMGFAQPEAIKSLPTDSFYVDVAAENINLIDADIVVLFPIGYTLDELKNDPLIQRLPAVKDGRAIFLTEEVSRAFSAGSVLSIPYALDELVPQLAGASGR